MQSVSPSVTDIVSRRTYDRILASQYLRSRILPEGFGISPYEILDYQGTVVLLDPAGGQAVFRRTQQIRFLQEGVSAVLDHFWGDGVSLASYRHSAGQLGESFRDDDRHHLAIDLPRSMHRGELLTFDVERMAMASFLDADQWLETTIDHPIRHLGQRVIFPPQRPCRSAQLVMGNQVLPLRPVGLLTGGSMLRFTVPHPKADVPYLVRWRW